MEKVEYGETLTSCITNFLKTKAEERKSRESSGKWKPSSLGSCMRKQAWKRANETETNPSDERQMLVFESGTIFHSFISNLVARDFPGAQFDVLVQTDDVKGYADIVLEEEVVEIKTHHPQFFWHLIRELKSKPITEIKPEHILQGAFYAIQLKKKYLRLFYLSRGDLTTQEFKIPITDEIIQKVRGELYKLNNYWTEQILPPALPRLYGADKEGKPKECGYCPYLDKCKDLEGDKHPCKTKGGGG